MIDYIGRFVSSVSTALEFNQATLSGCIDVVVIEQEDGTLMCTPFHVRFGKLKVLKSKEKTVSIQVNGEEATFKMKLGAAGDGFFEEQKPHRQTEDIMSDDQSDPENYMSSEDDSELNSPRRDENQPSSPQTEGDEKRKRSKSGKKWTWLWKSTPEDAIQSEKDRENEMQQAIEKLVRNEIGTQEKIELVHDLAKGPSVEELPQPHEPRHHEHHEHHEMRTAEDKEKEMLKESHNTSLLEKVEDLSTHAHDTHADDEGENDKHMTTHSGHSIRERIHAKLHHHQEVKKDIEQLEEAVYQDDAALKGYKIKNPPTEEKDHNDEESKEENHEHHKHHGHHVEKEKEEKPIEKLLKQDKKRKHKKSEEGDEEADAKDTDEFALNVDQVDEEKVLKHEKKGDPIKQLADDLGERERTAKEIEKEKEKKKRGILRSFLGMFKSEKDEKDKASRKALSSAANLPSSAENHKKSGFKGHLSDSAKQESKQDTNTESDVMSFPDEIENIEINLEGDDETTHKSSKKEDAVQNGIDFPPDADIELSLCANEIDEKENEDLTGIFLKHRVPYSKFIKDPFKVLSNPNLMVKIDDKLYDWKIACPLIVSLLAFKRPLPEEVLQELSEKETNASSSSWRNWFSLSKKDDRGKKDEKPKKEEKSKKDDKDKEKDKEKTKTASTEKAPKEQAKVEEKHPREKEKRVHHHDSGDVVMDEKPPMITEKQIIRENLAQEEMIAKAEGDTEKAERLASRQAKVRRTLRPNSEMLKTLNLKPGCNTIVYTVQGGIQGEKTLAANLYLWPANSKIIISDIDGTITKSDVLGQLMPMMGRDWSQPGVASLYSNIRKNGYQILYLTARAIGQSQLTKDFLNSITQGGFSLPPGPVILSPDRLVPSFKREIIYRKPEVFKIACLRDLRSLFPPNHNPFYAGFGNRETDAIAYQAVGMPSGKIFTINPLGEIRLLNATYSKSYVLINDMVNDMFPGIEDDKYQASEEYNLVNYFKVNYETLIDFDVSELIN